LPDLRRRLPPVRDELPRGDPVDPRLIEIKARRRNMG
jgi:hypothetical protein